MRGVSIYNSGFNEGYKVELAGVKLELGSTATPFIPRSYGEELALCQRYYEKGLSNGERTIDTNSGTRSRVTNTIIPFKVTKRLSPTISYKYKIGNNVESGSEMNDTYAYKNVDYMQPSISIDAGRSFIMTEYIADAEIY